MPKKVTLTDEAFLREAARRLASLGGKARAAKLTKQERIAVARKAGKASGKARRKLAAKRSTPR